MATTENDLLVRLVIQGQDPSEIQRLAAATQGQLNDKMKIYLDQLTDLHKQAAAAQTAEVANVAKAQIEATAKQLDAVNQMRSAHETAASRVQKANEESAHKSAEAWQKHLETMFLVVETVKSTFEILEGGIERFEHLAESIADVTAVYGSLKGSIDAMRDATSGEVSDLDLIRAKNSALQKELRLTDAQFGIASGAANAFASAIGSNTTDALNQLLDGLASGNVKLLRSAGIVVNADEAYKAYAKSIGTTSEQLTDHGKKLAIVHDALVSMDRKVAESGVSIEHFGNKYEQVMTKLKNLWSDVLKGIGTIVVKAVEGFTIDLPDAIRLAIAKIKDLIPGGDGKNVERVVAQHDANLAAFYGEEENAKKAAEAKERLENPANYAYANGDKSLSIDNTKAAAAAKKAQEEADKIRKTINDFEMMLRGGKKEGTTGLDFAPLTDEQRSHDLDTAFDASGSQRAAPGGLSGSLARQAALRKAYTQVQELQDELQKKDQTSGKQDVIGPEQAAFDLFEEQKAKIDKLREKAGGGALAMLLYGPDGSEKLLSDLDNFKNTAAESMGMVADAGHKMAEALGQSLAAFVSGSSSKSLRQQTHDILEALSAQAYTQAIMQTAFGFAALGEGFLGNPAGFASATQHFISAATFATVGTAAGLGARGVGNGPQAKSGAGSGASGGGGSSVQAASGSSFGSGGVRSSGGGSSDQPVVININAPLGDRAEIGRGVSLALAEYYAQSGRGVPLSQGSV